jgi:hypothetical protein
MRRRLLQHITAGSAGCLCGLLQQALAAESSGVQQGIRRLQGTVFVDGNRARVGMRIPTGATVSTESSSEAAYVVGADAFLQRADSRVQIGVGAATVFRVITGGLLTAFGRGGPRRIQMPVATAGIRGTGCYIQAEARRTHFCLCYGAVDLTPVGGQSRSYTTKHHDRPYWIEDGNIQESDMLSHEDSELALLESFVGRRVPFPIPYRR